MVQMNHSGAEICTANIPGVDTRIKLDGEFASGEYVLIVNGTAHSFSV
jgi:hypothetical protein